MLVVIHASIFGQTLKHAPENTNFAFTCRDLRVQRSARFSAMDLGRNVSTHSAEDSRLTLYWDLQV